MIEEKNKNSDENQETQHDEVKKPVVLYRDLWKNNIAFMLICVMVLIGFFLIGFGFWRKGTTLIGISALVAAIFRAVLPTRNAGFLHMRSVRVDVFWYLTIGVFITELSYTISSLGS